MQSETVNFTWSAASRVLSQHHEPRQEPLRCRPGPPCPRDAGRRSDAGAPRGQAGRRPSPHAARGPAAGLQPSRERHELRHVARDALLQQPRRLRPAQAARTPRDHRPRAGGEVVLAGQLPEPRVLSAPGRALARRAALHLEGREVHLRHGARGPRRAGEAPHQPAQGVVRQRRGHRGARLSHRDLPAQAPAAFAAGDARLRLLTRAARARAAGRAPRAVRRHRPLQAQGMEAG